MESALPQVYQPLRKESYDQEDTNPDSLSQYANGPVLNKNKLDSIKSLGEAKGLSARKHKTTGDDDSAIAIICAWIVEHQIGLALNLLLLHALTHLCFPRARQHTRKFFELSYFNFSSGEYALGQDDAFLVIYWIIAFTGLRASVMDYVLVPLAQQLGIGKRKQKLRFAEQAWILIYYGIFWSMGMYLMYNSNYWFNPPNMWIPWPIREMTGLFKWYYLIQFAFWVQQILVVNIEERRKDHVQMLTHHLVTCALVSTSYCYYQTRVGNVILCLMDMVDLIFPFAKILKYLKFNLACDVAFGVFMIAWFITRHIFFMRVWYSLYAESPNQGCYWGPSNNLHGPLEPPNSFGYLIQPFRDQKGLVCWNTTVRWMFLSMLAMLQVILLVWFGMIIRVASKVIKGGEAEDSRSDDEEEGVEGLSVCISTFTEDKQFQLPPIEIPPLEEEVGVEALDFSSRRASPARRYRKSAGAASGVALHSDRKELLGRIGCDKGS